MKELHVTIDYADDIESAGGWYGRGHIEQTMAGFRELALAFSLHDEFDQQALHRQIEASLESAGKDIRVCRYSYSADVAV